ncbi:hypothetical protein DPX16_22328 [Anabarilius grahami]|uniref:Uncharacterized protein n=1 Tax=Anabarilius grahami TaxID=495550 RepID=A0A3N0YP20_ANAGA|nr:hypothetical protein DPX16_22328 [Anabarilius grahami]
MGRVGVWLEDAAPPIMSTMSTRMSTRSASLASPEVALLDSSCLFCEELNLASLVMLECHLWLNLTEIEDADRTAFLDSPIFGFTVDGFAERYIEAQKSLQAMCHFLPKRASSITASTTLSKTAPLTQQRPRPASAPVQPQSKVELEVKPHLHLTKCYPFPKHQGPCPKLELDPEQLKQS